jgi:predicted dehydrogenase
MRSTSSPLRRRASTFLSRNRWRSLSSKEPRRWQPARRHKVTLGVVLNQRHEAVHQEARRLVLDGAIGEVKLAYVQVPLRASSARNAPAVATWRTDPKMRPQGIVTSIGDHAHDTLAYIVGQRVEEVTAFTDASPASPKERIVSLLLKLSGGAIGHAVASYITPFAQRPFEIHGTKRSLIIENSYVYLVGGSEDPTPTLTLINESGTTVRRFAATECFRLEVEQFSRAIEGKGEPMTPGEEGLRALAIGEAIYAAVASGTVRKVADYLPKRRD